jgi:cytochrome P450
VAEADVITERDYFTDHATLLDPYDYFEGIRARGPAVRSQLHDLIMVTGFAEAVQVLLDTENYSSVVSTGGPVAPMPFAPEGDDITAQIEAHRGAFDGDYHAAHRALLASLFTPSRLKANEAYMTRLADEMAAKVVADGGCEIIADIASAYVTLVVADLLGVPAEDREIFREVIDAGPPAGALDGHDPHQGGPLEFMATYFVGYIMDRRANPRGDILSELANAKLPDGTTPELMTVVKLAMFLFAAGQDTSAKLIGNAMRTLAEDQAMQARLRADRKLIPAFIEEMLRLEGSTKMTSRIARRATTIGDLAIEPGQRVFIGLAAANRDPRRWPEPTELRLDRPRIKEHVAFGRGAHTCLGAPLARVEVRVILEKLFEHSTRFAIDEAHHRQPGERNFRYEPSFIIRGLEKLFVKFEV